MAKWLIQTWITLRESALAAKEKSEPIASALLVLLDAMNAMLDTFLRQNRLETIIPEFRRKK